MANETKACSLTQAEIEELINHHGCNLGNFGGRDDRIERINYLNKRLKAFNETEKPETETKPAVAGWGTPAT